MAAGAVKGVFLDLEKAKAELTLGIKSGFSLAFLGDFLGCSWRFPRIFSGVLRVAPGISSSWSFLPLIS